MMKVSIKKRAGYCSLALLFPLLAACSSDSPSEPYKDLKQVNFPQEKSTVLLTKPTDHIVDGYNQLLEIYSVLETLAPIPTIDLETRMCQNDASSFFFLYASSPFRFSWLRPY